MEKLIAVSYSDFEKYGCVNCGCEFCYSGSVRVSGTTPVTCGECKKEFVILADGVTRSRWIWKTFRIS
jgi:hypothetical protein